jgi:hypothetical protein
VEWFNRRKPPRPARIHLKFDPLITGGPLYDPSMQRPQEPAVRASLFNGVYRPAFIIAMTPSRSPMPELEYPQAPLSLLDPSEPTAESISLSSASAPPQLATVRPEMFYSEGPKGTVRSSGLVAKQSRRRRPVAVRPGWKGYAVVDGAYLHPDNNFVDTVPIFAHRTRSGR